MSLKQKSLAVFFVLAFALLLGVATAGAAGEMVFEVGEVEGELTPGTQIEVPVKVTSNPGYTTGTVDITWDKDNLELTDVGYELAREGNSAAISNTGSYTVDFGDDVAAENFTGTGVFFTLVFSVTDSAQAGDYTIGIKENNAGISDCENQQVESSYKSGKVKLKAAAPAPTVYTVKVNSSVNGEAAADKKTAAVGDTITITAKPADDRYKVDKITVKDKDGKDIKVSGTYTFAMPASDVTVTVSFKAVDGAKFNVTFKDGENGTATTNHKSSEVGKTITITPKPNEGYEVDTVTVKDNNQKTVKVTANDNGTYSFVMPEGDVSVEVKFKAANQGISIQEPKHGKVTVDPKETTVGESVNIKATPDDGYEVDTVTVLDGNGKTVKVTKNSDGTYSFIMPASGAKVFAAFKEINCPSKPFQDLNTNLWYHEGVDYAIANRLMKGVAKDQFDPYGKLNRAMLVTILYRLEGEPIVSGANPYSDVEAGSWYDKAVNWADSKGIVMGYGNGQFGPTDNITREQMAAMMMRYASFKKIDISKRDQLRSFVDVSSISSWALPNMQWAVAVGLIEGSNKKLMPLDATNRAEAATILMRFCNEIL